MDPPVAPRRQPLLDGWEQHQQQIQHASVAGRLDIAPLPPRWLVPLPRRSRTTSSLTSHTASDGDLLAVTTTTATAAAAAVTATATATTTPTPTTRRMHARHASFQQQGQDSTQNLDPNGWILTNMETTYASAALPTTIRSRHLRCSCSRQLHSFDQWWQIGQSVLLMLIAAILGIAIGTSLGILVYLWAIHISTFQRRFLPWSHQRLQPIMADSTSLGSQKEISAPSADYTYRWFLYGDPIGFRSTLRFFHRMNNAAAAMMRQQSWRWLLFTTGGGFVIGVLQSMILITSSDTGTRSSNNAHQTSTTSPLSIIFFWDIWIRSTMDNSARDGDDDNNNNTHPDQDGPTTSSCRRTLLSFVSLVSLQRRQYTPVLHNLVNILSSGVALALGAPLGPEWALGMWAVQLAALVRFTYSSFSRRAYHIRPQSTAAEAHGFAFRVVDWNNIALATMAGAWLFSQDGIVLGPWIIWELSIHSHGQRIEPHSSNDATQTQQQHEDSPRVDLSSDHHDETYASISNHDDGMDTPRRRTAAPLYHDNDDNNDNEPVQSLLSSPHQRLSSPTISEYASFTTIPNYFLILLQVLATIIAGWSMQYWINDPGSLEKKQPTNAAVKWQVQDSMHLSVRHIVLAVTVGCACGIAGSVLVLMFHQCHTMWLRATQPETSVQRRCGGRNQHPRWIRSILLSTLAGWVHGILVHVISPDAAGIGWSLLQEALRGDTTPVTAVADTFQQVYWFVPKSARRWIVAAVVRCFSLMVCIGCGWMGSVIFPIAVIGACVGQAIRQMLLVQHPHGTSFIQQNMYDLSSIVPVCTMAASAISICPIPFSMIWIIRLWMIMDNDAPTMKGSIETIFVACVVSWCVSESIQSKFLLSKVISHAPEYHTHPQITNQSFVEPRNNNESYENNVDEYNDEDRSISDDEFVRRIRSTIFGLC